MQLFLAFIVALSITAALIPVLAHWAPALGLTDAPGPRKVHAVPVPRVGGLAMAAGVFAAVLPTVPLSPSVRGLLLGLVVLVLFGLWDDRATLGYGTKLAGQLIAVGLCTAVGGIQIGHLTFGDFEIGPSILSSAITFIFLTGITNAINLADGLDGLAGGMALLCLCAVALLSVASGNNTVLAISLSEAGAVLGFLRFNTHPARVFMGDCGSQMLGLSIGALTLLATQGENSVFSAALPLLLLGLPIVDTLSVMLTRIRAGRSPFSADRNHLHHRLLGLGFAHREAVLVIYVLQAGLVLLAYFLRFELDSQIIIAFCVFAASLWLLLRAAAFVGWNLNQLPPAHALRRYVGRVQAAVRLDSLALGTMVVCLALYGLTVLVASAHVGIDLGVLCCGLLSVFLMLSAWRAERSLQLFERTAAYVIVVLLVYLDQTSGHRIPMVPGLSWILIGVTGGAAFVRFALSRTRRFELTTLDLIVIFIAIVLPNLPGSLPLPPDLPGGVAKAVILLYVVEMLLNLSQRSAAPRVYVGVVLTMIAGRSLISLAG